MSLKQISCRASAANNVQVNLSTKNFHANWFYYACYTCNNWHIVFVFLSLYFPFSYHSHPSIRARYICTYVHLLLHHYMHRNNDNHVKSFPYTGCYDFDGIFIPEGEWWHPTLPRYGVVTCVNCTCVVCTIIIVLTYPWTSYLSCGYDPIGAAITASSGIS